MGRVISFTVITTELTKTPVRKAGLGDATCRGGAPDVCATLSTSSELHHEHQTEVQLFVLAEFPRHRLFTDSSDCMIEGA